MGKITYRVSLLDVQEGYMATRNISLFWWLFHYGSALLNSPKQL